MNLAVVMNQMRLHAQRTAARTIIERIGLVTNYDPNNYAAKVALQPEGDEMNAARPLAGGRDG